MPADPNNPLAPDDSPSQSVAPPPPPNNNWAAPLDWPPLMPSARTFAPPDGGPPDAFAAYWSRVPPKASVSRMFRALLTLRYQRSVSVSSVRSRRAAHHRELEVVNRRRSLSPRLSRKAASQSAIGPAILTMSPNQKAQLDCCGERSMTPAEMRPIVPNRKIRDANPTALQDKEVHEIHTVKFGAHPSDKANKIFLSPETTTPSMFGGAEFSGSLSDDIGELQGFVREVPG
jgi:hypothetical protein